MMSPEVIRSLSAEAALKAARLHKLPLMIEEDDLLLDDERLVDFLERMPFLGDYITEGYERVDACDQEALAGIPRAQHYKALFVDASGWGTEFEPALTLMEFAKAVRALGPDYGYALAEHGMFQVNIWVYRKVEVDHA